MDVELLLGLQQAYADLCETYHAACTFTPLRARAEREFLPHVHALGARLRAASRQKLEGPTVENFAREMRQLLTSLRQELEQVRTSEVYRAAAEAYRAEHYATLEALLPQIFADLIQSPRPPELFYPFEPAAKHRRPGQAPFLPPVQCARELEKAVASGIPVYNSSDLWWETDFPFVLCSSTPAALSSPIWLAFNTLQLHAAILADATSPSGWRVFTKTLHGPVAVGISEETDDEWWLAQEPPFQEYRLQLLSALQALQMPIEIRGKWNC